MEFNNKNTNKPYRYGGEKLHKLCSGNAKHMINTENIYTENGGRLWNSFHMREDEVAEQDAWCAVSNALLHYAKNPSFANALAVEGAARKLSVLRARFEALEKEIETRKARSREAPVRRYLVGAAGGLPSHP